LVDHGRGRILADSDSGTSGSAAGWALFVLTCSASARVDADADGPVAQYTIDSGPARSFPAWSWWYLTQRSRKIEMRFSVSGDLMRDIFLIFFVDHFCFHCFEGRNG
jgi:hypothetical protein